MNIVTVQDVLLNTWVMRVIAPKIASKKIGKIALLALACFHLSACFNAGYRMNGERGAGDGLKNITPTAEKDRGPAQRVDMKHIPDAVPTFEARTIAGNKSPYKVMGKIYHVATPPHGYSETGRASWYGKKFHGNKTANGEVYDMYAMTAAHPTLPIPSYVRVTNRENQRQVVVRINDRGPFHPGRIIDLTYAAAQKLGFVEQGTAPVLLEYLDMPAPGSAIDVEPAAAFEPVVLQVAAFSQEQSAQQLQRRISEQTPVPVNIIREVGAAGAPALFKVHVGPIASASHLQECYQLFARLQLTHTLRVSP